MANKNKVRQRRALETLRYYKTYQQKDVGDVTGEDEVTDLLADLRHYCGAHDISFVDAVRMSEQHYEGELLNPNE